MTVDLSTREQILNVARALFADKGYDATSMREIAQAVNISKPALYYHFDSKEEILRALVDESIQLTAELIAWTKQQTPSREVRVEVFNRWADIVQRNGLLGFRFVTANRSAIEASYGRQKGLPGAITQLGALLTLPSDPPDQQLRICMSLLALNTAGWVGSDLDSTEAEVLSQSREIGLTLMP